MTSPDQVTRMTDLMARFIGYTGKVLPDDVTAKLTELRSREDDYNIAYTNKIPIGSGRYVRGFRGLATMEYPFGINEARVGACANTHEE